jgi:hypothetical protein
MAPDFSKLSALEEDVLAARLEAVRASISHGGEKGRALEFDVRQLLRGLLPPEYGLTTGFIASTTASGTIELSSQLDIIVYDAIRHSPLIHLESWDVLPIEAVGLRPAAHRRARRQGQQGPNHDVAHCPLV